MLKFINEDISKEYFVTKWTDLLLHDMAVCITKYECDGSTNVDAGDLDFVKTFFEDCYKRGKFIESFLLDLVVEDIENFEDIVIAIYGLGSEDLRIVRRFNELYENMDNWDEDYMWRKSSI